MPIIADSSSISTGSTDSPGTTEDGALKKTEMAPEVSKKNGFYFTEVLYILFS